jgi:hypothetical protein
MYIQYVTIYTLQYTDIFLASRDFLQEQQSYLLTGSPLSKYEGGQNLSPFYHADKVEMNFNTF